MGPSCTAVAPLDLNRVQPDLCTRPSQPIPSRRRQHAQHVPRSGQRPCCVKAQGSPQNNPGQASTSATLHSRTAMSFAWFLILHGAFGCEWPLALPVPVARKPCEPGSICEDKQASPLLPLLSASSGRSLRLCLLGILFTYHMLFSCSNTNVTSISAVILTCPQSPNAQHKAGRVSLPSPST